ncbi:MAG: hypothetical protein HQK70_13310 [Desulfamplus sp.]|nr:hypothetical protein [Desulfamplus sp.]
MLHEAYVGTYKYNIRDGLESGLLTRWGGVVRISKGYPDAGQIVTILQDIPNNQKQLISPTSFRPNMPSVMNVSQGNLGQILGLTSIGCLASVVNLGVSAYGFYVMNNKLNEIQSAMHQFQNHVEAKFDDITNAMQKVQYQLVELKILSLENREQLRYILQGLFDIQRTLYYKDVGTVLVALQGLDRIQSIDNSSDRQRYIDDLSRVRLSFQNELDGTILSLNDHSHKLLSSMMSYRLWAIAGTGEVHAKRRQGELEVSAELAHDLANKSRDWSTKWSRNLIDLNEYAGIGRFGYTKLRQYTTDDQRMRLGRLFNNGENIEYQHISELELKGSSLVVQNFPLLGEQWIHQQSGIANTLDMLEENTERLESLSDINKLLLSKRLNYDRWESVLK